MRITNLMFYPPGRSSKDERVPLYLALGAILLCCAIAACGFIGVLL